MILQTHCSLYTPWVPWLDMLLEQVLKMYVLLAESCVIDMPANGFYEMFNETFGHI